MCHACECTHLPARAEARGGGFVSFYAALSYLELGDLFVSPGTGVIGEYADRQLAFTRVLGIQAQFLVLLCHF